MKRKAITITTTSMISLFHFWILVLGIAIVQPRLFVKASILALPFRKQQPLSDNNNGRALLVPWTQSRTAPTASLDEFTPNGQPASLWLYQGSLTDPLTGKILAHVEGFEIVTLQGLWQNATSTTTAKSSKRAVSFKAKATRRSAPVLQNATSFLERLPQNNPVTNWTRLIMQRNKNKIAPSMQAAAVWESRKVFLYRSTDPGNDLLTTVRLRPAGPQRKVPLSQAIATWHAQTTVLQPVPTNRTNDKDSGRGSPVGFFFGTAFKTSSSAPSTLVWNTAPVSWEEADASSSVSPVTKRKNKKKGKNDSATIPRGNLEFTIHARPRRGDQEAALQRHFAQLNRPTGLAPPRAALISLGISGSGSNPTDATAAHETYRFSLPSGRLSYSRYGEGPVWYGPHRTCRLELRGQHAPNFQQLSPVVQELVRRLVTAPELTVDVLFPEEVRARQAAQSVWEQRVEWLQPYWQRLVQATTMQALSVRSSD